MRLYVSRVYGQSVYTPSGNRWVTHPNAMQMAITDLNKIAAGIHVERWGSKLELVR